MLELHASHAWNKTRVVQMTTEEARFGHHAGSTHSGYAPHGEHLTSPVAQATHNDAETYAASMAQGH
jgi:hypothetical protein